MLLRGLRQVLLRNALWKNADRNLEKSHGSNQVRKFSQKQQLKQDERFSDCVLRRLRQTDSGSSSSYLVRKKKALDGSMKLGIKRTGDESLFKGNLHKPGTSWTRRGRPWQPAAHESDGQTRQVFWQTSVTWFKLEKSHFHSRTPKGPLDPFPSFVVKAFSEWSCRKRVNRRSVLVFSQLKLISLRSLRIGTSCAKFTQ